MERGGLDVGLATAYIPEWDWFQDLPLLKVAKWLNRKAWKEYIAAPYYEATNRMLDLLEEQAADYNRYIRTSREFPYTEFRPLTIAKSRHALDEALDRGDMCLVHSVEGGHSLQCSDIGKLTADDLEDADFDKISPVAIENLNALWQRGVAYLTLAHFYPNICAYPCFPYPEYALKFARKSRLHDKWDHNKGLTPTGVAVVERMFELGMLVDITHCTPPARSRVYQLATHHNATSQIIATHMGAKAINPDTYCLEDWEIKWLADNGGVVGVIFMNYWLSPVDTKMGMKYVTSTIEHLHKVGGEDVIAMGCDLDGFTDPPDELADMSKFPRLTRELAALHSGPGTPTFSDEAIKKIMGGNSLRVLREGWKR
tara:strand:- start:15282 stop:16391 length:1110 start_codon:yes stop_codon:yes gene_type:complete